LSSAPDDMGFRCLLILLAVTVSLLLPSSSGLGAIISGPQSSNAAFEYVSRRPETIFDVARRFDIGAVEIMRANPGTAHTILPLGTKLVIPESFRLPAVREGIVIDLAALRLYYFDQPPQIYTFPVTVGKEGWETPRGVTKIVRKKKDPSWTPPASIRAEDPSLPAVIPPGPDNPLGERALYLGWAGYALHGTNRPSSIGRRSSHGCIRLYPEDISLLFDLAPVGTKVTILEGDAGKPPLPIHQN